MPLTRRTERRIVFQMLFAASFQPEEETGALYDRFIAEVEEEGAAESRYVRTVFCGAREYIPQADALIEKHAEGWNLRRISRSAMTILRLAIYEMTSLDEVPVKIAINEAVELAKQFADDGAPKFINGILGSVAKCSDE